MAMKDVFSTLGIVPQDGDGFNVVVTGPITDESTTVTSLTYGFTDWADVVAFVGELAQGA